jgi:hypothetical protein
VLVSTLAAVRSVAASTFGSDARLAVEIVVGADPMAWRELSRLRRALRFMRRVSLKGAQTTAHSSARVRADTDRRAKLRRTSSQTRAIVMRKEARLAATLLEGGGPSVLIRTQAFAKTRVTLGPHTFEVPQTGLRSGVLRVDAVRGEVMFVPAHAATKGE